MPLFTLARLLFGLSFRAAYPLGAPLLFGVLVVASVIFGPTGMRAAEVTHAMRASIPVAIALWAGWLVLSLPVARLALTPPGATYLRWLPAPRALFGLVAAAATMLVELPWVLLFLRGEGVSSALTAALAVLAAHALLVASSFRAKEFVAALLLAVAVFAPVMPALPASLAAASLAVSCAIKKAPEIPAGVQRGVLGKTPVGALAAAHVLAVIRKEPASLGRSVVLAVLAALAFPLAARGYDLETDASLSGLVLGLSAASLPTGLSAVAAAVMRSERAAAWLCDATGLSPKARAGAAMLATGSLGALLGFGLGLGAAAMQGARVVLLGRAILLAAAFGAATGVVLMGGAREADASPKRGDRAMVHALVWTIAGVASASLLGETAIFPLAVIASAIGISSTARALIIRRRRGFS